VISQISGRQRIVLAILIGLVEAYAIAVVFFMQDGESITDAFTNPMTFFAASIVCTAGISLFIWIPGLWALGAATLTVFGWISPHQFSSTWRPWMAPSAGEFDATVHAGHFRTSPDVSNNVAVARYIGLMCGMGWPSR